MKVSKGLNTYKTYWEGQASLLDKSPWAQGKILKLNISTDFIQNIAQLKFSSHSLRKEIGEFIVRVKVPYNHDEIDSFTLKAIELLGIHKEWLTDSCVETSHCIQLNKQNKH